MENQNDINNSTLDFAYEVNPENHSIIKVVGVGGGGSNAVQHMFDAGIMDVDFLIINTDKQALKGSSIPHKLLISDKGLGAGAKPEIAHDFALQYSESIRNALSDGTEMVFITAGMGGGTGTGAAPIVAQIAQELGILTVGIVTIPFRFEGRKKIAMALDGVKQIEKYCDALIVVNNNRLIEVYPDLTFGNAFAKADDTLTTAAKSISDIINVQGYINLDFADVSTTLRNGGVALISTGVAQGENRLSKAIKEAITSPLLQDNNINDARRLLFELCFSSSNPLSMAEIAEMNKFVESLNADIEVIWGAMIDETLGDDVRIILLASGFSMDHSTGNVLAGERIKEHIKENQKQLSLIIDAKRENLSEFAGFPEAEEIFNVALRAATDKVKNLTIDDSVEDEDAKLDIALQRARDKKEEMILLQQKKEMEEAEARKAQEQAEALKRAKEEAEAAHRAELEAKIAALQAELNGTTAQPTNEQGISSNPKESDSAVVTPQPIAEQPQDSATDNTTGTATVTDEPKVADPVVTPATSTQDGIDKIRQYYGEETANQFLLSDARKTYYILDDNELSNEELIRRLEQIPAYNRSLEDYNQLRAISRQPAQPRTVGAPKGSPDGTINF